MGACAQAVEDDFYSGQPLIIEQVESSFDLRKRLSDDYATQFFMVMRENPMIGEKI